MQKDILGLQLNYQHPMSNGLIWLVFGAVFISPGLFMLDSPDGPLIMPIAVVGGGMMIYIGLVMLVNRMKVKLATSDLVASYTLLPYRRTRRLPSNQIKQLYVLEKARNTKYMKVKSKELIAILLDNRRVSLVRELPTEVLHYIEVQVESWLGLRDRRVRDEFGFESPEEIYNNSLEAIREKMVTWQVEELSHPEKVLFTLYQFEHRMMKGGFELAFRSFTEFPFDPVRSFEEVQAFHTADVIRRAGYLIPERVRSNGKELKGWLKAMDERSHKQLSELEEEFHLESDKLYELEVDYLNTNREQIKG